MLSLTPFDFELFPQYRVQVGYYLDVQNAKELVEASERSSDAAATVVLIDSDLIIDTLHLRVAINMALLNYSRGVMKTGSLASEVVYYVSPIKHFSASANSFRFKPASKNLILVLINMTEGGSDSFQFSIQGTLTDLQHLHQNCNIAEIKRLFKIPDAIETNKTADDSAVGYVITRISSKDVLKK